MSQIVNSKFQAPFSLEFLSTHTTQASPQLQRRLLMACLDHGGVSGHKSRVRLIPCVITVLQLPRRACSAGFSEVLQGMARLQVLLFFGPSFQTLQFCICLFLSS